MPQTTRYLDIQSSRQYNMQVILQHNNVPTIQRSFHSTEEHKFASELIGLSCLIIDPLDDMSD